MIKELSTLQGAVVAGVLGAVVWALLVLALVKL